VPIGACSLTKINICIKPSKVKTLYYNNTAIAMMVIK